MLHQGPSGASGEGLKNMKKEFFLRNEARMLLKTKDKSRNEPKNEPKKEGFLPITD
jgi:hypothetical protein